MKKFVVVKKMVRPTKITLPSLAEIPEIKVALGENFPVLSDFSIANGAYYRSMQTAAEKPFVKEILYNQTTVHADVDWSPNTGKIWTRTLSVNSPDQVVTYDFTVSSQNQTFADANNICVMPRFQNPAAMGVGVATWEGHTVLTIKNKIVVYPRWDLDKVSTQEIKNSVNRQKTSVGQYHTFNKDSASMNTHEVYSYANNSYVRMDHVKPEHSIIMGSWREDGEECWFANRPIRAMRCKDGSIQCLDQLPPCRFETREKFNNKFNSRQFKPGQDLDLSAFEVGQSLRQIFNDLQRSAEFTNFKTNKLAELTNFALVGLKIDDCQTTDDVERII